MQLQLFLIWDIVRQSANMPQGHELKNEMKKRNLGKKPEIANSYMNLENWTEIDGQTEKSPEIPYTSWLNKIKMNKSIHFISRLCQCSYQS